MFPNLFFRKIFRRPKSLLDGLVIVLALATVLRIGVELVEGVSSTFTQGNWSAGQDTATALANATGWSRYVSKDAGVSAGANLTLVPANLSAVQTSDYNTFTGNNTGSGDTCSSFNCSVAGGFNAGTKTNTEVTGTGASASVVSAGKAGLVGLWHLNEATSGNVPTTAGYVTDTSGNGNSGTFSNVNASVSPTTAYAAGKLGGAITFDGVDDSVIVGDAPFDFSRTSPLSIGAWIKTATTGGRVVAKIDNTAQVGYELFVKSTGGIAGRLINTGTTNELTETSTFLVNDDAWHYVVMTYDGSSNASGLKLYVDGTESTTTIDLNTLSGEILNNNNLRLGARAGDALFFAGLIDEAAVYSRVLSAAEISDLYNSGAGRELPYKASGTFESSAMDLGSTNYALDAIAFNAVVPTAAQGAGALVPANMSGLVGLWHLDGTAGAAVSTAAGAIADSQTNVIANNGTASNANAAGMAYAAGRLNTAINFDGVDDYVDLGNPAALQLTGAMTASLWIYVPANQDSAPLSKGRNIPQDSGWEIDLDLGTAHSTYEFKIATSSTTILSSGLSPEMPSAQWHHIVGVYIPSTAVQVYVDGRLASQVTTGVPATQYNSANPVAIGMRPSSANYTTGLIDEVAIFNRALSADEIKGLYQSSRLQMAASNCANGAANPPTCTTTVGWGDADTPYVGPDGTVNTYFTQPIALWHLNESSGAANADSSGNGNTGTLTNMTTTSLAGNGAGTSGWNSDAAKLNNALKFDGANDYVQVTGTNLLKPREVTMEAWIKTSLTDTSGSIAASMGDYYTIVVQADGNARFAIWDGVDWPQVVSTGINVKDGQWHHIVGQKSATELRIYIDGVAGVPVANAAAIVYTGKGPDFIIGKHANGSTTFDFNGLIDEVAVYDRVLTAAEVSALYNAGAGREGAVGNLAGAGLNNKQYIKYKAALGTADTTFTPQIDDITLAYSGYPSSAALASTKFDASQPGNYIKQIIWSESNVSAGRTVAVSLKSAETAAGLDLLSYLNFTNASAGCTGAGTITCDVPATMDITDAIKDRWFQYQVALGSDGSGGPAVSQVQVVYDTAQFSVTGSAAPRAGIATPFTITAKDSTGTATLSNYGSISVPYLTITASTPPTAVNGTPRISKNNVCEPTDYNFTTGTVVDFANAAGLGAFSGGALTLYACFYDAGQSLNISAWALDSVSVSTPLAVTVNGGTTSASVSTATATSPIIAGSAGSAITVTLRDSFGNPVAGNTVSVSSSRGALDTITPATAVTNSSGVAAFTLTTTTVTDTTNIVLTATDTTDTVTLTQQPTVVVDPGVATTFVISGSTAQTAGAANALLITAKDGYGNTVDSGVNNYTGDKLLTFSGALAAPEGRAPTVTDKTGAAVAFGTATTITFTNGISTAGGGMTLYKAENASIAATATGMTTPAALSVTVSPAAVYKLELSAASAVSAGTSSLYTVTRKDMYGNLVTSGTDTVNLASTSSGANKKFSATQGGPAVASVAISNGASSANFYYYDELSGTYSITATSAAGTNIIQTSDTGTQDTPNAGGFNAGTKTNTAVGATGTGASVRLLQASEATTDLTAQMAPWKSIFSDDFNRADATTLGAGWNERGINIDIVVNKAKSVASATGTDVAYYNGVTYTSADYSVSAVVNHNGNTNCTYLGVVGRRVNYGTDDSDGYYGFAGIGTCPGVHIYKRIAGVWTSLINDTAVVINNTQDYLLKLEMTGSTLKLYLDGVLKLTTTDVSLTAAGDAGISSGTGGEPNVLWDNFLVERIVPEDIKASVFDAVNNVLYLGGNNGRFGKYVPSTNTFTDLTSQIASFWGSGNRAVLSLAHDVANGVIYLGGGNGSAATRFAKYTIATGLAADLTAKVSGFSASDEIFAMALDAANNVLYLGFGDRKFGRYNTPSYTGGGAYPLADTAYDLTAKVSGFITSSLDEVYALAFDQPNQVLYLGAESAGFVRYNTPWYTAGGAYPNADTAYGLISKLTSAGFGTGQEISALALDQSNQVLYVGGGSGRQLFRYNTSFYAAGGAYPVQDTAYSLTSKVTGIFTSGASNIYSLALDSSAGVLYIGGDQNSNNFGRFAKYTPATDANATGLTPASWSGTNNTAIETLSLAPDGAVYLAAWTGHFAKYSPVYAASGTFESVTLDLGGPQDLGTLTWTPVAAESVPATMSGLVGLWRMNEATSGNVPTTAGYIADASASGNNGTFSNVNASVSPTTAYSSGKLGGAITFDGVDDKVSLGTSLDISALPFAISAWINPVNYSGWRPIFCKRDTWASNDMRFELQLDQITGNVRLLQFGDVKTFNYSPPLGQWTHLAVVANLTGTTLYVNGQSTETLGVFTLGSDAAAAVSIGRPGDGGDAFLGLLDEIALFNRALTANEIAALYSSLKLQLAANNDNLTWNYVGPDGTVNSYFTTSGTALPSSLDNNRYIRYKAYLAAADTSVTPSLDETRISYTPANTQSQQVNPGATSQIVLTTSSQTVTAGVASGAMTIVSRDQYGNINTADTSTVNLSSTSATMRFDTSSGGLFDGSITSVTLVAGQATAYFKDTTAGTATITLSETQSPVFQTSDTGTGDTPNVGGFNAGTKTSTAVSGTGSAAKITLPSNMTPGDNITTGTNPYGIAYDAAQNAVWVVNYNSNTLQKFNASTGAQIGADITTGIQPTAVAYDPTQNAVWVVNYNSSTLQKFNASTGAQIGANIATGSNPRDVVYDSSQNAVWVVNATSNTLQKFNASTGAQIGANITTGITPFSVAYDPAQNAVWVVNYNSSTLQKFNASTGAQIGADIATGFNPRDVVYDSSQNAVWVVNYSSSTLQKFNASTGAQIGANITTGTGPEGVAYDPAQNAVWVVNYNSNTLQKFKASDGLPYHTAKTIATGTTPWGVAYDPTQNAVWVVNWASNTLQKFNASTGAQIGANITTGTNPVSFAFDATQNAVWVANYGSNTLQKFNASTGAQIGVNITTSSGPRGVAYDPTQNAVWVTNYTSNTLQKFNASTGAQIGADIMINGTNPVGVAYDSVQNAVWVGNYTSNTLQKFNASTGVQIGANITTGINPEVVAYDPTQNAVWVVNRISNTLQKFNASTGAQIGANITTGTSPRVVVYDPTQNAVWVGNYTSNTLQKFNASTGAQIGANIATGTAPWGIAYDSTQNAVWVTNSSSNTLQQILIPYAPSSGTFESPTLDLGGPQDLGTLSWNPGAQPAGTNLQVQLAANNDNATWNYTDLNQEAYPSGVTVEETNIRQDCTGYTAGTCYTSLSAWEAAKQQDLVAANKIAVAKIDGAWTVADTTAVTIDGWTTDATHYIKIYTTAQARHTGKWDDGKYRLLVSTGQRPMDVYNNNVRIEGLQIDQVNMSNIGVYSGFISYSYISHCIIKNAATGIHGSLHAYNNIIYNSGQGFWLGGANILSNNTVYNTTTGFYSNSSPFPILKNNISYNNVDNYDPGFGGFSASSSNNLSGPTQTDAPGTSPRNAVTVAFLDAAGGDFRLASTDTAAKNAGADLSADANLSFNTDIEGHLRATAGAWDIGAHEYGASGGNIPSSLDNNRYVRYKVLFSTADSAFSPQLDDLSIAYNSVTSQSETVNAGPVSSGSFGLNAPADLTAGGPRAAYTVTRRDQYNNLITSGPTTVYLYTTSTGPNARFYDAATAGTQITFVVIPDGSSSANFWYYDERSGGWTITASDATPAPDAATGADDATDALTVEPAPASGFVIAGSSAQVAGVAQQLTLSAYDLYNNLVSSGANNYTGDKSLTFTGANTVSTGGKTYSPTVKDRNGVKIAFGTPAILTFTNGVATAGASMTLYRPEAALIAAAEGAVTTPSPLAVTVTQALLLNAPNGTETWRPGTSNNISWITTAGAAVANVKLSYSTDAGVTYKDVIIDSVANSDIYPWTVPSYLSGTARVRVENAADPAVFDESNANFSFIEPLLTLATPSAASIILYAGQPYNITWTSSGAVSNALALTYSRDAGLTYPGTVSSGEANDGVYGWTVPYDPTVNAKVKIEDIFYQLVKESSDEHFNAGTKTGTQVSGTGNAAKIVKTPSLATESADSIATGTNPYGVAFDATQNAVWVTNYSSNTLQKFNASTGAQIGANITTGASPQGVAYDPTQNAVWVANFGSSTLQKFNASTGAQIGANITTGASPQGVAYDPTQNAVWVTNYNANTLQKFDAATGAQIGGNIITGLGPTDVVFDSAQNAVWVVHTDFTLRKFNASTGAQIGANITTGSQPTDVAYDPTQNAVWVVVPASNTLQKFNASTGAQIGANIATGTSPYGVVFDAAQNAVWVTNYGSNTLQKFNASTGAQIGANITTGTNPRSVVYDPTQNAVWVVNYTANTLQKFKASDGLPYHTAKSIAVGTSPRGVVHDSTQNAVWAVNSGSNTLQKFDGSTGSQIGSNIATGSDPRVVAYDPTQNAVWVANYGSNTLQKFNASTGAQIGTNVATGSSPWGIAYDSTQNAVWVSNSASNTLQKFNASTGAQIGGNITTGLQPRGVVFDPTQNAVWVVNYTSGTLQKFNASTGAQIGANIAVTGPIGVAYDPTQNAVWVTSYDANTLQKFNASTGAQIGSNIATGTNPVHVAYDPTQNAVWVVNYNGNTLQKFNASTGAQIGGNITTGLQPRGVVFDPTQNAVWVVNFTPNTLQQILIPNYSVSSSGTFESRSIDLGAPVDFSTLSWTATVPAAAEGVPATMSGLVGLWHLNEATSGNVPTTAGYITDATGKGNNGTFTNANASVSPTTGYATGKLGGAINFDGVDDYVNVGSATSLDITGVITVSAWIKTTSWNIKTVVGKWDRPLNAYFWLGLGTTSAEGARFIISPGDYTLGYNLNSNVVINDGNWHHIAGVYQQGVFMGVYVDGILRNSLVPTVILGSGPSTPVTIGSAGLDNEFYFPGSIDEVAIFNRALSAAEIADLYSALKLKFAANNDNATWNYVGPDGTANSYFTASGTALPAAMDNNRYLRYKAYLSTADALTTPSLDDVTVSFASQNVVDRYVSDVSDNVFEIRRPVIAVTEPGSADTNLNYRWLPGDTKTILWRTQGRTAENWTVECLYLSGNPLTESSTPVFSGVKTYDSFDGTYYYYSQSWTIPALQTLSDFAKIRVTASGTDAQGQSVTDSGDSTPYFKIVGSATLAVVSPASGANWYINSDANSIQWNMGAPVGDINNKTVTIQVSTDAPLYAAWTTVTATAVNNESTLNSFSWNIPSSVSASTAAKIKIFDNARTSTTDTTAWTFNLIAPSATITSPLLDEEWIAGSPQTISWTSTNGVKSPLTLAWSSVNSPSDTTISAAAVHNTVTQSGNYNWAAVANSNPGVAGDVATLKIFDPTYSATTPLGTRQFKIMRPVITLLAPVGSETWRHGEQRQITWSTTPAPAVSSEVKIEYSIDNGSTWSAVVESEGTTPNDGIVVNDGALLWTIPNLGGVGNQATQAKIRITDAQATSSTHYQAQAVQSTVFNIFRPNFSMTLPAQTPLRRGATYTFMWSPEGTMSNNLDIGYDPAGVSFSSIASQGTFAGNFQSFTWTVPVSAAVPTSSARVRVTDATTPFGSGTSAAFSVDRQRLTFDDTTVSGATWVLGTTHTLGWTTEGEVTTLNINFYRSTTPVGTIDATVGNNSLPTGYTTYTNYPKTYSWTIANSDAYLAPGDANIVLSAQVPLDALVSDSSAMFTIREPYVTVTLPAIVTSSGYWVQNESQNITWSADGALTSGGTLQLSYANKPATFTPSSLLESDWVPITTVATTVSSYSWTPNLPSGYVAVRVKDINVNRPASVGYSAVFQMSSEPLISILAPTGTPSWKVGTDQTISWANMGSVSNQLTIEYSTDNGATWNGCLDASGASAVNLPATGTFVWRVPASSLAVASASQSVRLKITDTQRPITQMLPSPVNVTIVPPLITVTAPATGNTWLVGQTTNSISWTTDGGEDLATYSALIQYLSPASSTWVTVTGGANVSANARGTTTFGWAIPDDIGTSQVRVTSNVRPATTSGTSSNFTIAKLALVGYPGQAVNESYTVGTSAVITWSPNAVSVLPNVNLQYFDGTNWYDMTHTTLGGATTVANSSGASYTWTIPDTVTALAKVRVVDPNNPTVLSESTNVFKIAGSVNLTAPSTGASWVIGTSQNVTWSVASGTMTNMKLQYSPNGGTTWKSMSSVSGAATTVPNTGTYAWAIPDDYSATAMVRVYEENNLSNTSTSAGFFTIASPQITLSQPTSANNGTGSLTISEPFNILWTTTGSSVNNLRIEASYDGQATWTTVAASWPNTGSYAFTPTQTASQGWVKITELSTTHPSAIATGGPFTILPAAQITVSAPATGNTWLMGRTYNIIWATQGLVFNNLRISYTLDSTVPTPTWVDIASGQLNTLSYYWAVPDLPSVLADQPNAKVKITDDTEGTVGLSNVFTLAVPTVSVVRPAGGEVWAVGDVAPVRWSYDGAVVGPMTLQYDAGGTVTDTSPTIATGVAKTGTVPNTYTYDWTVPVAAQTSTVKVRVKDSQRPNSKGDSAAVFSVIAASTVTVSAPVDGNIFVVEEAMTVTWATRGLGIEKVNLEYWNDTDSDGVLDAGETLNTIAADVLRGSAGFVSDTSDAYSGRYSGTYTWTVPQTAPVSSNLKLRVRGFKLDNTEVATGLAAGHFRIRGGFEFRDETTPTQVLASTTDWKAGTGHNVKWYNKGSFANVKLEYAISSDGTTWGAYAPIAASLANAPDGTNVSTYGWTVVDPHLALYPTEPPAFYYVKLKLTDLADTTITAESSAFRISYYTVTWRVQDYDTFTLLDSLTVTSSYGSTNYWQVANDALTAASDPRYVAKTYPRRYPYGTFTTFWSKSGYIDRSDANRTINADTTVTVYLESVISAQMEYKVYMGSAYDETADTLMFNTWLEKKGTLILGTDPDLGVGGTPYVNIYDGQTLIATLTSASAPDANGNYWFNASGATQPTSSGGLGLVSGKTYFAKVGIWYRSREYQSGASFDITLAQQLKQLVETVQTEVSSVATAVATEGVTTRAQITSAITSEAATTRQSVDAVRLDTGRILTAAETTLPQQIKTETEALKTEVATAAKSEILNRENIVMLGNTIVIKYRTYAAAAPLITVYDPDNAARISGAPMAEVSPGLYEYAVLFESFWQAGDYSIVCSEPTYGTLDAIVITAKTADIESISSDIGTVIGTMAPVRDLKGKIDAFTAAFGLIEENIERATAALAGAQAGTEEAAHAAQQMESLYNSLHEMSAKIQELGATVGYDLEKLYEVSETRSKDIDYIRNKTQELKALLLLSQQMIEGAAKEEPVVQTWFEFR